MPRSTIIIAVLGCVLLFTVWIWTGEETTPAAGPLDESASRSAAARPVFPKPDRPRSLLDRSGPRQGVDKQEQPDGGLEEEGDVVARAGVEPRPGSMNERRAARQSQREARLEAKRAREQADGQHAGVVRQGQGQLSRREDEPDAMAKVEQPPLRQPETMDDEVDEDSLEHLRDVALADPDPDERADALSQLDLDDPAAMDVLVKALDDSDTDVRLAALDELWTNSDEPPLDILARVIHDTDPEVRLEAVRILSESDEPYAQQLLRTALMDRDEEVREEAADALEE